MVDPNSSAVGGDIPPDSRSFPQQQPQPQQQLLHGQPQQTIQGAAQPTYLYLPDMAAMAPAGYGGGWSTLGSPVGAYVPLDMPGGVAPNTALLFQSQQQAHQLTAERQYAVFQQQQPQLTYPYGLMISPTPSGFSPAMAAAFMTPQGMASGGMS